MEAKKLDDVGKLRLSVTLRFTVEQLYSNHKEPAPCLISASRDM